MDGYTILASFLLLFVFFIYITWFGFSVKIENEKEKGEEIKLNPYDNLPLHRKLIDKKNSRIGALDLGNHILIIGLILLVIFVTLNVE
jgi:Na+/H+ antiporter NhaC